MRFVRKYIKNNATAINNFTIEIYNETNLEELTEFLSICPKASTFTFEFVGGMSVQKQAEQFWKVLLIVFYCNTEDKIVNISRCNLDNKAKPVNWNFVKKSNFNRYQTVHEPGTIKQLFFSDCHFGQSQPDLKHLSASIEGIGVDMAETFLAETFLAETEAQCLLFRLAEYDFMIFPDWIDSKLQRLLNEGSSKISKFGRLEVHIEYIVDTNFKEPYMSVLSKIQHPNMHVVFTAPIRVADVFQQFDCLGCHSGYELWKKYDVKDLITAIQSSAAKTLTYSLPDKSTKVTFNCDENLESTFMEFLETQPIFIGRDKQCFTTRKLAKESFDNGCKCYCSDHCRCDFDDSDDSDRS